MFFVEDFNNEIRWLYTSDLFVVYNHYVDEFKLSHSEAVEVHWPAKMVTV